ncbi:MAG: DeoR/GlpR family DNA-binding transcription regulator [Prolixibacteraceae bacterium]
MLSINFRKANQRRERILELLQEEGRAKVNKLAVIFKVSEVTIRQDLERLEYYGFIRREHEGAFLKNVEDRVKYFPLLNQNNLDKKKIIGRKAAELIKTGETIILDSGSTTIEIARNLVGRSGLTIITNALNIAMLLGAETGIDVIVSCVEFKLSILSLTSQKAAIFFDDLHADKLFLATACISLCSGLTYPNLSNIEVKKAMIETADLTFLVADSTQIGKNAFVSLRAFSLIDYIITDPLLILITCSYSGTMKWN